MITQSFSTLLFSIGRQPLGFSNFGSGGVGGLASLSPMGAYVLIDESSIFNSFRKEPLMLA